MKLQLTHTCNRLVLHNTPTHRFSVQPDGTAVDLRTGSLSRPYATNT
jgi:hypothetical protein